MFKMNHLMFGINRRNMNKKVTKMKEKNAIHFYEINSKFNTVYYIFFDSQVLLSSCLEKTQQISILLMISRKQDHT